MIKKLKALLLLCILTIAVAIVPDSVQAKDKGYLVLFQADEKKWIGYEDLVCESPDGHLMVKAYRISKRLDFNYDSSGKNFSIITDNKSLTFTKNSAKYVCVDYDLTTNKTAPYKAYTSTAFGEAVNVIEYSTLRDLPADAVYYSASEAPDYKELGYKGVICFSTQAYIKNLPDIKDVFDEEGFKLVKTSDPINQKIKSGYNGTVTIADIQVPKLTKFADKALKTTNWGADVFKEKHTPLEDAMDEFNQYLHYAVIALNDPTNYGHNSKFSVLDSAIISQINGDTLNSVLRLYKREDHYGIYINTRLFFPEDAKAKHYINYTKICNNVVKMYCTTISSTPDKLYQAIYDSWETDNTHGINKKTWVTIGDSKVKFMLEGNGAVYMIKKK